MQTSISPAQAKGVQKTDGLLSLFETATWEALFQSREEATDKSLQQIL